MIREAIGNEHTTTITYSSVSGNTEVDRGNGGTRGFFWKGIGCNTEVTFNPDSKYGNKVLTQDSSGKINIVTKGPSEINLAHELGHAVRSMNGDSVPYNKEVLFHIPYGGSERVPVEEMENIGMGGYKSNFPTENQLRKENGYDQRVSY